MTGVSTFRQALQSGSVEAVEALLEANPDLANTQIAWGKQNLNKTDPLHFISDSVFNGELADKDAAALAEVLIRHGAQINGSDGSESPLIGASSLYAAEVAAVLISHGADINLTSVFGSTALHWASFTGLPTVVELLLDIGAEREARCSEFASTPLFWAVQGFSKYGPEKKTAQVEAAQVLIAHGADIHTKNIEGVSAIDRSLECNSNEMTTLLRNSL